MKRVMGGILAAVMTLSLLTGCGSKATAGTEDAKPSAAETAAPETAQDIPAEGLYADLTGIAQNAVAATLGDTEFPAEFYFYWLGYSCSSLEYFLLTNQDGNGYTDCVDTDTGTIDWTGSYNGVPLMEYTRAQTEGILAYYAAVEQLAAENGVVLTEDDRAELQASAESAADELGGEEAFAGYLKTMGISRTTYDRINAVDFLNEDLLRALVSEDGSMFLTDDACAEMTIYADQILIPTTNLWTGAELSAEEVAQKKALAEDLMSQIRAAEDPEAAFDELSEQYNQDPNRSENPDGFFYIKGYSSGMMPQEAEAEAARLKEGEISDLVKSEYGYHIVLRRDVRTALEENPNLRGNIAEEYLASLVAERKDSLKADYASELDGVEWTTFYDRYQAEAERLDAELGVDTAE